MNPVSKSVRFKGKISSDAYSIDFYTTFQNEAHPLTFCLKIAVVIRLVM